MFAFNEEKLRYLLEKLKFQLDKKADKLQIAKKVAAGTPDALVVVDANPGDGQIAIGDPRLVGSGAVEGDYVNIVQKGLSTNDFTNEDKQKLQDIKLITEGQIDTAFTAAGFDI